VLHQIGAGARGPVFRAYDPDQDRLVAVKLIHVDVPSDRLSSLAKALGHLLEADLAHPALVSPIAAGMAAGGAYLAQDFVAADSLDSVLSDLGCLSPFEVVRVAAHVASALDLAAARGVWHGALHLRDVLVSQDDVRLSGLGVMQALDAAGVERTLRPPYSAPEIVEGRPWDQRADVFSLAVIVGELLTGQRHASLAAKVVDVKNPDVRGPDLKADDGLSAIKGLNARAVRIALKKAMSRWAEVRYADASSFVEALRQAVPEATRLGETKSEPAPAATPTRSAERRHGSGMPRLPLSLPLDVEPVLRSPQPAEQWLPGDVPLERASAVQEDLADEPTLETASVTSHPRVDEDVRPVEPLPLPLPELELKTEEVEPAADRPVDAVRAQRPPIAPPARPETPLERPSAAPSDLPPLAPEAVPAWSVPWGEASQSAVWPITLALLMGLIVGVAVGFFVFAGQSPSDGTASATVVGRPLAAGAARGEPTVKPGMVTDHGVTPAVTPEPPPPAPPAATPPPPKPAPAQPAPASKSAPAKRAPESSRQAQAPAASRTRPAARTATSAATVPLVVESRPAGAVVFLDDRRLGVTPFRSSAVPTGSHALRIELDGYRRWTSVVNFTSGEPNRVTASLEPY
jgi:eukaryotic-like serine/threonine-protein kinase